MKLPEMLNNPQSTREAEKESVRLRLLLSREKFYDNLALLCGAQSFSAYLY
jgi:hypothetical protein